MSNQTSQTPWKLCVNLSLLLGKLFTWNFELDDENENITLRLSTTLMVALVVCAGYHVDS